MKRILVITYLEIAGIVYRELLSF